MTNIMKIINESLEKKLTDRNEFITEDYTIDDLVNMGMDKITATTLWESEHGINVKSVTLDELFREMDKCWK